MKKKVRMFVAFLAAVMMLGSAVSSFAAAGWQKSGSGWWYDLGNGSYLQNSWLQDGEWYYFDQSGWMVTGWKNIQGSWYYFEDNGAMTTGWSYMDGFWYYFNDSGEMLTGWQLIEDTLCYFDEEGHLFEEEEETPSVGPVAGGWNVTYDQTVTAELNNLFFQALDSYQTGMITVSYTPVALLGTQVVAGTNYAILSKASIINQGSKWVIVYMYRDLQGNASVISIKDVVLGI